MKRYVLALSLGAALFLPVRAQDAGNADNGKKLFFKNGCYECHGTVGQGGTGPHLAPKPLATAALTAYVRKPGGGMPPYSAKVMSNAEVADIRAYLATIPEPPKDIPLLKP
jgi:ubiquinol-cytochrome c reductase cytochrome c subunit